MKLKNSTSFLKTRREALGLDQQDVARDIGVEWDTYRQWEHRGQIVESKILDIARVLRVSEMDLLIAKYVPFIADTFVVDADALELFLRRNSKK